MHSQSARNKVNVQCVNLLRRPFGLSSSFVDRVAGEAAAWLSKKRILKARKGGYFLSIALVGKARMSRLNGTFRKKPRPTDVLSFASGTMMRNGDLGELILCPHVLKDQAKRFHVTLREETARMVVHGFLHLLGYDHMRPREARKMFALQEEFLLKFSRLESSRKAK